MLIRQFIQEERGVVSLWLLLWSFLFIAFAGLAIDVSNAMRMRSMLQATSDASSHAGVIALLTGDDMDGVATAVAAQNMGTSTNGNVVVASDVDAGWWDTDNRQWHATDPGPTVNRRRAVRVVASRINAPNKEAVPTSLLRILDFETWNIATVSVSAAGGGRCTGAKNRVITPATITYTSNNTFDGDICLFAYSGHAGTQNNIGGDGVLFLMNDPDTAQNKNAIDADNHGWHNPDCNVCVPERTEMPPGWIQTVTLAINAEIAATGDAMFDDGATDDAFLNPWVWNETEGLWESTTQTDPVTGDPVLSATLSSTDDYVILPSHKNGNNDQTPHFNTAYAAGARSFYIHCQSANGSFAFNTGTNLDGVNIFSGDNPTSAAVEKACSFDGSNLVLNNTRIATESDLNAGGTNASVALTGQPANVFDGTCPTSIDSGLEIYTLGGVNVTAQADMGSIRIWSIGEISFTAGLTVTGHIDFISLDDVSFTAGTDLSPSCGAGDIDDRLEDDMVAIVD